MVATDINLPGLAETTEAGRRQGLKVETASLDVGDPEGWATIRWYT